MQYYVALVEKKRCLKLSVLLFFSFFLLTDVTLKYKYGRLVLEIPLPSRNEKCLFFLRPMLMSVGDLIEDVQREDPGVTASVFSTGGTPQSA